ncbi:hypothetical protein QTG54_012387 [Skeletonema marinoi]|uniref:Uncharacterized protein n=1 Tax=Skeletonema marinoi TaxID=267567 RepID=A0AAD8Y0U1_9STRA|nr:hypothetical protein QTG54_012387 [Skeletonema marinoi]
MSVSECNAFCDKKLAAAASSSDASCPPNYLERSTSYDRTELNHQIIQDLVAYLEGLIGPSTLMLLLVGCFVAVMVYFLQRIVRALFFSSGPYVRTYYADEEREKMMMQNVSYYRSPTAATNRSTTTSTPSSSASRPPTASLSSQRNERNECENATQQQQQNNMCRRFAATMELTMLFISLYLRLLPGGVMATKHSHLLKVTI